MKASQVRDSLTFWIDSTKMWMAKVTDRGQNLQITGALPHLDVVQVHLVGPDLLEEDEDSPDPQAVVSTISQVIDLALEPVIVHPRVLITRIHVERPLLERRTDLFAIYGNGKANASLVPNATTGILPSVQPSPPVLVNMVMIARIVIP